jgi:hypothetical protein
VGANAGAKTDASGDDQGEYVPATNTVTVRLGAGANGAAGGSIPIGGTATVRFDVTVNAGFTGSIANQATVSAAGLLGAPAATTPTDGNGGSSGSPPTTVIVDQCATNANCTAPTPTCETSVSPHVCVGCLVDLDCGSATSATVCNAATLTCVPGCRGTGGNGCDPVSVLDVCTSTDATIGTCVDCLVDSHCGGPKSGTVCNAATSTCGPGCRGTGGNGCMASLVCTSTDAAIGQCIGCLVDGDCGGATSGQVCDATLQMCVAGCRGTGGNGCDPNAVTDVCTSSDATIGACVDCTKDGDCGGPTSAKVCDLASQSCIDGCRGTGGNGCDPNAVTDLCTSTNGAIGQCVDCITDGDCGNANSGRVCDTSVHACIEGCRGSGGNGCIAGLDCTSTNATIGQCVMASSTASSVTGAGGAGGAAGGGGTSSALVAEGGGLCTVTPGGDGRGRGLWLVTVAALGLTLRRRHRVGRRGMNGNA